MAIDILIALQHATMWAHVPLDNLAFSRIFLERAPEEGPELTQLGLRRCAGKSRCPPRDHWTQLAALLSQPAVHRRVYHLDLHGERCNKHVGHGKHRCVRVTDDLLNHLLESGLHAFCSLSLRGWRNLTLRDDVFETCASLFRLEIIHCELFSVRTLHALETLILHDPSIKSEPVDAHALLDLFHALPQLQNLSLYMTLFVETNDLKQQPVELPNPRQLTLRDPSPEAASMLFLLNKVCIPRTARTSVTGDCCQDVSAILHCFCALTHPPDALLLTLERNSISLQTTVETCAGSRLDPLSSMGCSALSEPRATRHLQSRLPIPAQRVQPRHSI